MRRLLIGAGLGMLVLIGALTQVFGTGWMDDGIGPVAVPSVTLPSRDVAPPTASAYLLAEVTEDQGYVLYESRPDRRRSAADEAEERLKVERSWEMLRNLVIIPYGPAPAAPAPSPSGAAPGPVRSR